MNHHLGFFSGRYEIFRITPYLYNNLHYLKKNINGDNLVVLFASSEDNKGIDDLFPSDLRTKIKRKKRSSLAFCY
jgi:hypothetical protein